MNQLKKTALHRNHLDLSAKMGAFAGYDMPLYYDLGVMKEHLWTRESCGLFDVSHMGQARIEGLGATELLERLTPSTFSSLKINKSKYTVLMNDQGGMIDDLIITRTDDETYHMVLNAGCKDKDIAHIQDHLGGLEFYHYEDWALLALQGPKAEAILHDVLDIDARDVPFMSVFDGQFKGENIYITRSGYTGEDGFEIAVENKNAPDLWDKLLSDERVRAVGLAARDSLRLEMGYPLYGHDIDDATSPIEADIGFIIGKDNTDFTGSEIVLTHRDAPNGFKRKRMGLVLTGKGVAREGSEIRNLDDEVIGTLTSGGYSPSLEQSIGMGYVCPTYTPGDKIFVNVRGRNIPAEIRTFPFLEPKTKSMKKKQKAA